MLAVQANTKLKLTPRLADNTVVRVEGYSYLVDFGSGIKPRFHTVLKNERCTCDLGADCPAIESVREYWKAGGGQAPEPPLDYYVSAPGKCPLCGARVYETGLVHPEKGVEWGCNANPWHYRQQHLKLVLLAHPQSPWRFPPVVVRDGIQMNAWDGTLAGDHLLYAGVLEKDVMGIILTELVTPDAALDESETIPFVLEMEAASCT
jgi:hypothetical protein